MPTTTPYLNVDYIANRTASGRPSDTPIQQKLRYYSFGNRQQAQQLQLRGQWVGANGPVDYATIQQWAASAALAHPLAYTLLLSVRDGQLEPDDFASAMAASDLFDNWYLITHYDTDHDHAHAVAFADARLTREQFDQWKQAVGTHLQARELAQLDAATRQQTWQHDASTQPTTRSREEGFEW